MDRYQANNTYPFGSLKDFSKTQDIVSILEKEAIRVQVNHDVVQDEYILSCQNPEEVERSQQVFLQVMGMAPVEIEIDPTYEQLRSLPIQPVTLGLIILSVLIYSLGSLYGKDKVYSFLMISPDPKLFFEGVKQGEIYRLVTPMLLHFNLMHIIFNLLWLKDLGKIIEGKFGSRQFLLFVLILSLTSNLLQYMVRGPLFGGMSGVVYGLLGYLWMAKTFKKEDILTLPKRDNYMMIGWFFLCFTGIFGPIANLAHGAGLTIGMIAGINPFYNSKKGLKWIALAMAILILTVLVELFKLKGTVYYEFFI